MMTTNGGNVGWTRQHVGCGRRDIVERDRSGIEKQALPTCSRWAPETAASVHLAVVHGVMRSWRDDRCIILAQLQHWEPIVVDGAGTQEAPQASIFRSLGGALPAPRPTNTESGSERLMLLILFLSRETALWRRCWWSRTDREGNKWSAPTRTEVEGRQFWVVHQRISVFDVFSCSQSLYDWQ